MKDRKVSLNVNVDAADYELLAKKFTNVSDAVRRGIAVVVADPSVLADVVSNLIQGGQDDNQSKQ